MKINQRKQQRKKAYKRYCELKGILPTIRLIAERMGVPKTYLEYTIRKERINEE